VDGDGEYLALSWDGDDGDGIGRLTVTAVANAFSVRSRAWFDRGTIEELAEELTRYPLDADQVPRIEGGFVGEQP
jgi:hypothetical protein